MANEEHLNILKRGMVEWNEWRRQNRDTKPDLSGARLDGWSFNRPELDSERLISFPDQYDLRGVDLSGASLVLVHFAAADFFEANLQDANLSYATFSTSAGVLGDVTMAHANLRRSFLVDADLTAVNLQNTNFDQAILAGTRFGNNDLSAVVGLDTVVHLAPSFIGIDTIYRSEGNIPEGFLRGCGVPDTFITFARSLVGTAIEYYSAFISYSSKNQDIAERLYSDLQSKSVRCWFAPEDLKIGDKFRQRIDEAIRVHDKLLLILSEDSISSAWVEQEVESAIEREQRENHLVLFPVRIDDAVMNSGQAWAASLRRARHIGDFSNWTDHDSYRKAFDRLLRDLKAEAST